MATSSVEPGGVRAWFRGYVDSAPRIRYSPQGEALWEFGVRLHDEISVYTEIVTVRVPDKNFATLQRWVVPGRHLLISGLLHLARWQTRSGKEQARLLVDPTLEVMPLDTPAKGSEPAALAYRPSPAMSQPAAIPPRTSTSPSTNAERAAQMRTLLEETNQ